MKKVIRLSASWCGPCKVYAPIFDKVTENLEGWEIETLDIETPEGQDAARLYEVRAVPTTVFINGDSTILRVGPLEEDALTKLLN